MSKLVDVDKKSEQEHALDRLVDEVIKRCEKLQDLLRDGGILSLLTKNAVERMVNAELDYHLNGVCQRNCVKINDSVYFELI